MKLFPIYLLLISINCFSQNFIPKNIKVDSTTKIIGRYPQYDKNKSYEKWNFILENVKDIEAFTNQLVLGEEVKNTLEEPNFSICLIHNYDEVKSWTINPRMKSVMVDGHTYKFDIKLFTELNKKFPFKYKYESVVFNKKTEYESYLNLQKKDSTFLFDYAPQFKYEGSFELDFPNNQKFSNPREISTFIEKKLKKINVKKDEYSISYILDERNLSNLNKIYTMTIQGPKKIFDVLKIEDIENKNWTPTTEDGMFFYKIE
jgi:hypothetical protein